MAKHKRTTEGDSEIIGEIQPVFSNGVIDWLPDEENWNFCEACHPLRDKLRGIKGAAILYERKPSDAPRWDDDSDSGKDFCDWQEETRSYHLFFIGPTGKRFEFPIQEETTDDHGCWVSVVGVDRVGYAVGVSMVAPYAIIKLDHLRRMEDGSESVSDIETTRLDQDGQAVEAEQYLAELLDSDRLAELEALRARIAGVLVSLGIPVLTREQAQLVVPDLKMGEDFCRLGLGDEVTVFDALFFMEP
jgi:hypothetical protein